MGCPDLGYASNDIKSPLDAERGTRKGNIEPDDEFARWEGRLFGATTYEDREKERKKSRKRKEKDLQMSHHTGAGLRMLFLQTIALVKYIRLPINAQNMKTRVPVFLAFKCHGAGSSKRPRLSPLITANATLVDICSTVAGEEGE